MGFGETTSLLTPDATSFILTNTSDSSVAQFFNGARNQTLNLQPNISINSLTLTGNVTTTTGVCRAGVVSAISTLTSAGTLSVTGNSTLSGTLTTAGLASFSTLYVSTSSQVGVMYLQFAQPTGPNPQTLFIPTTSYAGSSRARMNMGAWEIGQDVAINGGKDLYFYTGSSGVAMDINANGNIGFGTTSPAYKVDVAGGCRVQTLKITSQPMWNCA